MPGGMQVTVKQVCTCIYYWALVVTFNFKEYDLGGRMSSSPASVVKTSLKYIVWPRWSKQAPSI